MVKLKTRTELKKNIQAIGLFFIIVFCIISVRAYFLQVLQANKLAQRIENQHKSRILLSPRRGTVYDRNGTELAVSIGVQSLYARPGLVTPDPAVVKKLAAILKLPRSTIKKRITSGKNFVWLKRKLTPGQAEAIQALEIDGLGFVKENKRYYPNKELAGQVLGFAGIDTQGLAGIEFEYDRLLRGRQTELIANRDALGRSLFIEGIQPNANIQGHDLVLTIDKNIQYIAERELQAAVTLSEAKGGIAVVMDPWTGEVLALANVPLFNPNQFAKFSQSVRRNRAITDVFEPGSTFKPFLVAAALEEEIIKPRDIFFCENGSYRVNDKIIHDVHPHGWLSVTKILKYSSNIGVSKISKHLGKESFYQYIRKFGFAEETGIQFPIEATGFVPLPYRCSDHTQSAMAFGQGISVTPLQLAGAYSSLANGGHLVRPYIVKKIIDGQGNCIREQEPFIRHRVVSEQTAHRVRSMLQSVVSKGGTGSKAAITGFTVAGKTGTSQKIQQFQKGYCDKRAIASFAGFAPADHPYITVLVIIDEPQKMSYGGEIAAPVFSRMSKLILNYLHITPDKGMQSVQKGRKKIHIISQADDYKDEA